MPSRNDISHQTAVRWLFDRNAYVRFGRREGVPNVVVEIVRSGDMVRFEGIDFIDVVMRAKRAVERREHWEKE